MKSGARTLLLQPGERPWGFALGSDSRDSDMNQIVELV